MREQGAFLCVLGSEFRRQAHGRAVPSGFDLRPVPIGWIVTSVVFVQLYKFPGEVELTSARELRLRDAGADLAGAPTPSI